MDLIVGDLIQVKSQKVGAKVRRGTVVEVISEEPFELRVEWEDGHTSTFYPVRGTVEVVAPETT